MAIFAIETAMEAAAAAEAATAVTAATTAAGTLGATEAATAALTAGELGSAASGIASLPAGITPEVAAAMQQGATIGGQGAAAGMPPAGLEQLMASGPPPGAITSPVAPPTINSINPATGVPSSFSPTFDPTSGAGLPPPPPMPAAPPVAPPPAPAGITAAPPPVPPPPLAGPPPTAGLEQFGPYPELSVSGPPTGAEAFTAKTPGGMYTLPGEGGAAPTSAFERGLDKAMAWADKNPLKTAAIAYTGANALGLLNPNRGNFNNAPYDGPLSKYKLSPNFKSRDIDPGQYRYTPRYAEGGIMQMAQGGVTGSGNLTLNVPLDLGGGQNGGQSTPDFAFGNGNSGANTGFFGQNSNQVNQSSMPPQNNTAPINVGGPADVSQTQNFAQGGSTGNLSSTLDYYTKMMEGETPKVPTQHSTDVGIYHDTDPDTRSLDPYSAARTRLAKTKKRAYVSTPPLPAPTPMGRLNFSPPGGKPDTTQYQEAAKGGIMGVSDLGGYAAGGNPRLLKGPGDGMSDNIPATINGRQPARLADGEFVIPADVVSHLGNGSTEAGAKVLHQMMTKVRQERTGNPKQGKQINPRKYMPR